MQVRFEFKTKNTNKSKNKKIKYSQIFRIFFQNLEKQVKFASKICKQKLQAKIASKNCKQKAKIASKNCKQKLQARFEFKTRQIMKLLNQKAKVTFFIILFF